MTPSQPSSARASCGCTTAPIASSAAPMTRLDAGPASAMSASSRGERESASMVVAPPKMNSVMPATFRPNRRATSAWESSCARTEAKKRNAVAAADEPVLPDRPPGELRRGN